MERPKLYAVRITYQGHSTNRVMTAAYRTTQENRAACVRALAALEGVIEQEMEMILSKNQEYVKIELYTVSG